MLRCAAMLRPALCILLVVAAYIGIVSMTLAELRQVDDAMRVAARSMLAPTRWAWSRCCG
ncbi:MAG: hypothetical protein R3E68_04690 [Burkholderiaceae bacterium]